MPAARRVLSLVLVLGAGCERRTVAPPLEGLPPLSKAERAQLPARQAVPEAPEMPKMIEPQQGGQAPADRAAQTQGAAPLDPSSVLAGELRLDPKVKERVASGDTIFLVARGPGQGAAPGPVLAVKKLVVGAFPQKFSIDNRDAMMTATATATATGTTLSGKVTLMARVDKDGDAISKGPGDTTGSIEVKAPNRRVVLTLDTVLGPENP